VCQCLPFHHLIIHSSTSVFMCEHWVVYILYAAYMFRLKFSLTVRFRLFSDHIYPFPYYRLSRYRFPSRPALASVRFRLPFHLRWPATAHWRQVQYGARLADLDIIWHISGGGQFIIYWFRFSIQVTETCKGWPGGTRRRQHPLWHVGMDKRTYWMGLVH
jgi:hypothetical protein